MDLNINLLPFLKETLSPSPLFGISKSPLQKHADYGPSCKPEKIRTLASTFAILIGRRSTTSLGLNGSSRDGCVSGLGVSKSYRGF